MRALVHSLLPAILLSLVATLALAQKVFTTPEEASQALVTAEEHNDRAELVKILGAGSKGLVLSGDEVQDTNRRERFVSMAKESLKVAPDPANSDQLLVSVGNYAWPLPIPIVKTTGGYRFDAAAAQIEILARRIGHNELHTIDTLRQLVDAEREYAYSDANKNGIKEYAQRFLSTPGKHDGLYWEAQSGEPESPLAGLVEQAAAEGYDPIANAQPSPYHGYIFRILQSQGPEAAEGAYEYVVRGDMIGGFAIVAYPIEYGITGVKTFLVSHAGTVWEKDLGSQTKTAASAMRRYNPDKTWQESPHE
jgi:hypothetical protein